MGPIIITFFTASGGYMIANDQQVFGVIMILLGLGIGYQMEKQADEFLENERKRVAREILEEDD